MYAYILAGRIDEAEQALKGLADSDDGFPFWRRAQANAWFGRNDQAFKELESAVSGNQTRIDGQLVRHVLITVGLTVRLPFFQRIPSDPRWEPFRQKVGVSEQQLANVRFDVSLPPPF